jgi:predicted O-methyltransferase YrrM
MNKSLKNIAATLKGIFEGKKEYTDSILANQNGLDYKHWLDNEIKSIPGMISAREEEALFLLSALQQVEGNILEIGSWLGRSTVFLAKGCSYSGNGFVYAIDHFKGNVGKEESYFKNVTSKETISEDFRNNLVKAQVTDNVKQMVMSSQDAAKIISEKLRIIFIDADHSYQGTKRDIEQWHHQVISGGYFVFHDYSTHHPGVIKAVNEFISDHAGYSKPLLIDSLAIVQKDME